MTTSKPKRYPLVRLGDGWSEVAAPEPGLEYEAYREVCESETCEGALPGTSHNHIVLTGPAGDPDLTGVDPSHVPGVGSDNLLPGLVYCKRCCLLLASTRRGLASAGPVPCRGPAKLRPFEPTYERT